MKFPAAVSLPGLRFAASSSDVLPSSGRLKFRGAKAEGEAIKFANAGKMDRTCSLDQLVRLVGCELGASVIVVGPGWPNPLFSEAQGPHDLAFFAVLDTPARGRASSRHVPELRRTAQQDAAACRCNDRTVAGGDRKLQCDQALDHRSIDEAALRCGQTKRLQRFPLIACEIVVEFRVHLASHEAAVARVLQSQREGDATTMSRDFDHACFGAALRCN